MNIKNIMSNEQLFCHLITDEVYFEYFLAYIDYLTELARLLRKQFFTTFRVQLLDVLFDHLCSC